VVFTGYPQEGYNYINGQNFSTYNRDQDQASGFNCAQEHYGAWWYRDCYHANPNGPYLTPGTTGDGRSMNYWAFSGSKKESLRTMKLMFR